MPAPLDLLALRTDFVEGFGSTSQRVGLEFELLPLDPATGGQVPYDGGRSVQAVLHWLAATRGWTVVGSEPLLELERNGARLTLEPGAQVELSGAPQDSIRAVAAELAAFVDDIREASRTFGISFLPIGLTPQSHPDQIVVIPKERYRIMTRYLKQQGADAWWMMRATAGMQVNLDAADAAAAARLLRLLLRASPILTALFANSPVAEGCNSGWLSRREQIWLAVDPARCGYPPLSINPAATLDDYIEWALEAPMFFVMRDGHLVDMTGKSFRQFVERGAHGEIARMEDWHLHITTLFPEVRLKRYLEMRCIDSNRPDLALSLAALSSGLAYGGAEVWDLAESVVGTWDLHAHRLFHLECMRVGASAIAPDGRTAGTIAQELLAVARRGLMNWNRSDLEFLEPAEALAASGRAPAHEVLSAFERGGSIEVVRAHAL